MLVTHEMGFAGGPPTTFFLWKMANYRSRQHGDFFAGHVSERAQRFLTQILH